MSDKSPIEWTEATWNPVRGCSRVSPGCVNCYAERTAARFREPLFKRNGREQPFYGFVQITNGHPQWTGRVELIESKLEEPLHWKRGRRIFVNSMSDLFHESLPDEAIDRVFAVMALCPQHTFQVLTKRAERMHRYCSWTDICSFREPRDMVDRIGRILFAQGKRGLTDLRWPLPNVWLGVSAEDQQRADERIPWLLNTPAAVRFVSYEPALGPVNFHWYLQRRWYQIDEPSTPPLDWLIIGGESGPGARPFDLAWARTAIQECRAAGVACFVKQIGRDIIGMPDIDEFGRGHAGVDCYRVPGGYFVPPILGLNAFKVPPNATGFRTYHPKGGKMEEWPADLRVREYPVARTGNFQTSCESRGER